MLVIHVQGGLIAEITRVGGGDDAALVIDHDTDGTDPGSLVEFEGRKVFAYVEEPGRDTSGRYDAILALHGLTPDADLVSND